MDETTIDLLSALTDEYIGDDLTLEDLQNGYSAFVKDEEEELEFQMEMA